MQTLNVFFLRMLMNNAKICDVWPKMCFTYVATFHCPNAIVDQWRGGGEKHLKLN